MGKTYAKPTVTEYNSRNVKIDTSIKIATSNLFIETASVPVDYMVGATFDGIGGNEFINHGDSSVILQVGNSLVGDASDVAQRNNSITNQKGAIGYDISKSNFGIDLNKTGITSFSKTIDETLTDTTNKNVRTSPIVGYWTDDFTDVVTGEEGGSIVYINDTSINVYADEYLKNIYIELQNLGDGEKIQVEFIKSETVSGIM